ncbi:hypothetical protein E8F12_19540 [Pseudomonas sp. BN102]|nr:hypothetical protein [Pseudomonas sp. BN102]
MLPKACLFTPEEERGDSRRQVRSKPEAETDLKPCRAAEAGTPPLQAAERNRCAGGRAAWMPREACGAMDGPSRRAPGAMMERGKFGKAGPGCRGKHFASFCGGRPSVDCKRESPGRAKQKPKAHSAMGWTTRQQAHTRKPNIGLPIQFQPKEKGRCG